MRRDNIVMDKISKSSNEAEDNEVDVQWEALMGLPTYEGVRFGLSASFEAGARDIHVDEHESKDKSDIVDGQVGCSDDKNVKFLRGVRNRIDRVGISLPTVEVRFEHLNVEAETQKSGRSLPTLGNYYLSIIQEILECLQIRGEKKHISILKDASGIIRPSRITLLLGPPRSGRTTLLQALSGVLHTNLKSSGSITYNGHSMNEFVPQRTAAYISQYDLHFAQMTVRETLEFAARCQGVGSRRHLLEELVRREKAARIEPNIDIDLSMKALATDREGTNVIVDYVLKMLGLESCAHTLVGNEIVRGISGGEMKRLTTAEMLVGPVRALFMDEISVGLDSSTTFRIVNNLKQLIHIFSGTALISLLQPTPETYNLFDDLVLLSDGYVVYQGPRDNVLQFFESMGFKCPDRKAVPEFLQELTSKKDQEQYWSRKDAAYNFITAKQFNQAYRSFRIGIQVAEELSTPFDRSKNHPVALETMKYGVGKWELFLACLAREILLFKRNSFIHTFKFIQFMLVGIIGMTVFLRTEMHKNTVLDGEIFMGSLFFVVTSVIFNFMVELTLTIARLPLFIKQRDLKFYPSWAYALPTWILRIPTMLIEVSIWVPTTYYGIGYDPDIRRLFKQMLLLMLVAQMASALFRCLAVAARDMKKAISLGPFVLLILFGLGGFILSRDKVKKWWIWVYWVSPMMYGQNAIVVNEFLGKSWSHNHPNSEETLGVHLLKSRGFSTEAYWYWIGVVALIGFVIVFNLFFTMGLTFFKPFEKPNSVTPCGFEEESALKNAKIIDLPEIENKNLRITGTRKRMILPFEPHSIAFESISYGIDMPREFRNRVVAGEKLMLLQDINGAFRPGVLTALMGVSGAGKTTLMDVLAGRKTGGYIEGKIYVSGYPKKQQSFARISGYCEQFDVHSPNVSVYESLVYSAWLRLPCETDSQSRKLFVEEVMELVELKQFRNAMVGLPNVSGLSTDQRKRLTIAVELVANPSIIFMDEPTTGLDARAAAIVMRTVRNTVNTGRTVVCTIHQPSIDIFESFDELLLLKKGGQQIYSGPLGIKSCSMIKYFESIHGVGRIKGGDNPATWVLDVTSIAQEASGINFVQIYKASDLYKKTKTILHGLNNPMAGTKPLSFPTRYSQPFSTQFIACLWKQHRAYWQNPSYTAARLLYAVLIAVTFGSMFWDLGTKRDEPQDLFNAMGSMYLAVFFIGIQNAMMVQLVVTDEKSVFYRERAAGMYSTMPYAFAQVLIELPYALAQSVLYGSIVYAMIGFDRSMMKFFWYLFFMYFTVLYFSFFGIMIIALTPNFHISAIISAAIYPLWNLFTGFIVPQSKMSQWWRWYYRACPTSWTMYGLLVSQFGDVTATFGGLDVTVADFVRDYFGFTEDFLGVVAGMVVFFPLLFAIIYAISMKILNFQKR